MSIFDNMLKEGETLFKNEVALDFNFMPKLVKFRENEQFKIASAIKPLFQNRDGKNIIIIGSPGIGKTVACRHVLDELEEKTDEIYPIYINCWQRNTSFKVVMDICEAIGYKFTQNKRTDELFKIVVRNINKKSAVFVFDEIDKMEEHDFIYMILEEVYRKSIIMITNFNEWATGLDQRIKSRLLPERIDFWKYSKEEIKGILEQRMEYAFVDGVWEKEAFELVANKTYEIGDVRIGLNLMKEAGLCAEDKASKKIETCHIEKAMEKLKDFSIKDKKNLDVESKKILELAKENSGQKIGDLFKKSQEKGDDINYKSFQRKIKKLSDDGFIETEKKVGGAEGTTTIIKTDKKLTDY